MTKKEKSIIIKDYMDEILNDAKCELIYHKPYELVICVMLSAQTTDKSVNRVSEVLFSKYPSLESLMDANYEDVYEIIKPLGLATTKAKNVIGIAKAIKEKFNGEVPYTREELMSLPGVGRKTANVVLIELFKEPAMPVDTHVERVSKRLGLASKNDTPYDVEMKIMKTFDKETLPKLHHQLIHFGRYYCKAQRPVCINCKLKSICNQTKIKKN